MNKATKEKIDELKAKYPEGIYEGEISFTDVEGKPHNVEFIYRRPAVADGECYSKAAQKSVPVANLNFIQSLIVFPEPGPVIEQLREYPSAYAHFVQEIVSPFFGANFSARSRKL
jgi:hypothetical protein